MNILISQILFVGSGLILTVKLLLGGLLIGLILGTLWSVLRYKRICTTLVSGLISVIRGTPLPLQLSIVYFSSPEFLNIKLSVLTAGILTFGLNSSAYVAEIFRSGIENLPKGQFEAAKTLEIPAFYMWKDIIFPQVFNNILPAAVSEAVALLKESALITMIGGLDIMRKAQILAAEHFTYFRPLFIAGMYYYFIVLLIEYIGKKFEQRNKRSQQQL